MKACTVCVAKLQNHEDYVELVSTLDFPLYKAKKLWSSSTVTCLNIAGFLMEGRQNSRSVCRHHQVRFLVA